MKQIKLWAALCITVALLAACSEEDAPQLPVEDIPGMVLTERMDTDGGIADRTEEFYYNEAHQLTRRVIKQKTTVTMGGYTDYDSLRLENRVTYSDREAVVTDAFDNVSTYILNEEGYATSCIRREGKGTNTVREYTFAYSDDAALTEVMEIINGKIYSRIKFQPSTEKTVSLIAESGITNTFLLTLGEENTSLLPWLYLTGFYPLDLHQEAMYAQLLGKAPKLLIKTIQPEGGDEKTTYSYTMDKAGNLSSCKESILSDGYRYNRTINYAINPVITE